MELGEPHSLGAPLEDDLAVDRVVEVVRTAEEAVDRTPAEVEAAHILVDVEVED